MPYMSSGYDVTVMLLNFMLIFRRKVDYSGLLLSTSCDLTLLWELYIDLNYGHKALVGKQRQEDFFFSSQSLLTYITLFGYFV